MRVRNTNIVVTPWLDVQDGGGQEALQMFPN
ncbi:hypothetical protein SAMN05421539_11383 [Jannaschia seohaensis]|uniref:Uncharacterized protein n=1 Tax=Jannaschia seohaensis TaxID=475081 RepID=A0A2Y9B321_9RHOB|nr:hypothetical protein BCF38_11383 [Jannaschia seohaensis]SSA50365.1 hypothetical protein SAMN05421539_11383 [Jannaschia seohaensis]